MEEKSDSPARFFKVILPSTNTGQRLRIPDKFVEKYGNGLSSIVTLTDPIDGTWCVRLEKAEKTLWLHDGWEKFFDDHSIGYGYFLLFKYIGNSSFNVHIFDLTATEVDYHNNNNRRRRRSDFKMDENSDDDSVKILTSFPSKSDAVETSKSHRPYLTRSRCKIEGGGLEIKTENLNITSRKFSPKNPSFGVSLKPYNLLPRCMLYVPVAFSERLCSTSKHFELHDSDGKKWLLNIIRGIRRKSYMGKLGWKAVVEEKSLKVGDTCVFELIDVDKCMLKVFTFGSNTGKIQDGFQ